MSVLQLEQWKEYAIDMHTRNAKAKAILKNLAASITSAYGKQEIRRALRALEGLEK